MNKSLALAVVMVLSGWSASARAAENCSNLAASPYLAFQPTYHDHDRVRPQAAGITKKFTAYTSTFDDGDDDTGDGQPDFRNNPIYVAYELRGVAPNDVGDYDEPALSLVRPGSWYTSEELVATVEAIPGVTRKRLDNSYDGIGSTWNRGHMAMNEHAQRIGFEAACNTHNFFNAAPQAADLNQGPWRHLENYTAAASNKYRSIWIIDGPIFDPATPHLFIGDPGEVPIEVPDAFFKIIIHEGPSGIDTLAFIFAQPNAASANGTPVPTATWVNCNTSLPVGFEYNHQPNLVTIAEIEARTGLRFFADRPDREGLITALAANLWPVETRYWDSAAPCRRQRSHR